MDEIPVKEWHKVDLNDDNSIAECLEKVKPKVIINAVKKKKKL